MIQTVVESCSDTEKEDSWTSDESGGSPYEVGDTVSFDEGSSECDKGKEILMADSYMTTRLDYVWLPTTSFG